MNTIEFAVKDGVPYAIDFLNPAPDSNATALRNFISSTWWKKWRGW